MQGMKIYILIEDKENEAEVRIDGNLETLRGLIYILCPELADPARIDALSMQEIKQEGINVTG